MRAVRLDKFLAKAEDMVVSHGVPIPTARKGYDLVRVHAAAINPSDAKCALGLMPHVTLPRILGRDFAGVVAEGERQGQRVFGCGGDLGFSVDGSFADFVAVPSDALVTVPDGMSTTAAATAGTALVTAIALLDAVHLRKDDVAVVFGAARGVGAFACQLAAARCSSVVALVRRPEDVETVMSFGASAGFANVDEAVGAAHAAGASVAVDCTGVHAGACVNALKSKGRIGIIAAPPSGNEDFPLREFYRRELSMRGVNTLHMSASDCGSTLRTALGSLEQGTIKTPEAVEEFEFSNAREAFVRALSGRSSKVVLRMS
jgi:NADPH:quinone reductase